MAWRYRAVLYLTACLVAGCALRTPPPRLDSLPLSTTRGAELHGKIVALATQQVLEFETFVTAVAAAQVIAFGEEHYHPDIQAFALRLLQALAQQRPQRVVLAMEFLERDMQPALDAYLAGQRDAATLQAEIKATPLFITHYFPLVQYAQQARLPVLAMNAPRPLARRVSQEGLQAVLQRLSTAERAQLVVTTAPLTPAYRSYFLKAVAAAHPLPAEQLERFVEAAYVKDETMAESLVRWVEQYPDTTVLAIAGRFHVDYGLAIPAMLRQRQPQVQLQRLTTMTVAADDMVDVSALHREDVADYVWFTAPRPAEPKVAN